jgi:hypothetical protein
MGRMGRIFFWGNSTRIHGPVARSALIGPIGQIRVTQRHGAQLPKNPENDGVLVPEQPLAGKDHRNVVLVRGGNHFGVAH